MDAIQLLKDDHQTVEEIFQRFENAGENANKEKRHHVDRMIKELSMHAQVEEEIFYPATRQARGETEGMVQEAIEEHAKVKQVLSELETMEPEDDRFDRMVTELIRYVRHHVEEEENEMIPKVQEALTPEDLRDLGERMREAKKEAPQAPSEE